MVNLLKKIRMGRYTIPALLLVAIMVGSVIAAAYVVLYWENTFHVKANPDVCFFEWATGTKANSLTFDFDIFPGITTTDENMTYGIGHFGTGAKTPSMRLGGSWGTPGNKIQDIYVEVYNSTHSVYSNVFYEPFAPTDFVPFDLPLYPGKYAIYLEIDCKYDAPVDTTCGIEFQLQTPAS